MPTLEYYSVITAIGRAKIADSIITDKAIKPTQIALGDGGGNAVKPLGTETALKHEVYRGPINDMYKPIPTDPTQVACALVVPEEIGGWTVREVGLYDADGDLIAYGSVPDVVKPVLSSGSSVDFAIVMITLIGTSPNVQLIIDPGVVRATRR